MDYLHDWFKELIQANEIIKKQEVDTVFFLAVPTPVVELIFLKCLFFDQPDEVRYLSVELFERFIRKHFLVLLKKVWNNCNSERSEQWKIVESKLLTQTTLRMLSCIQIASKFIIHPKIIRPKEILVCLREEGKPYTLAMILASEMRVWETLELKVNIPTVLTYTDLILEQLKFSQDLPLPLVMIHSKVVHFIDIVYLHHQEIYRKLFYLSTGRWEPTTKEKKEYLPTESNVLYRATAVLAAAMTFTSKELNDIVYEQLSNLTNLSVKDIDSLSNILKQIVHLNL